MASQNESGKAEPAKPRDKQKIRFYVVAILYIIVFFLLCWHYLQDTPIFAGLIIGAIFPLIGFLYFHRNCLEGRKNKSILSWTAPSFFLHLIIVLGFCATLISPKDSGFMGSMYASSYKYGKLFKSFQEAGLWKHSGALNDANELRKAIRLYGSHFDAPRKTPSEADASPKETIEKKLGNDEKKGGENSDGIDFVHGAEPNREDWELSILTRRFATISSQIDKIPFYISLTFGFLGALIFCMGDAISRFNNADLYPKIYIFYITRFIISASLAVALCPLIMDELPVILVAMIFFAVGYFPERAIKFIDDKLTRYLGFKSEQYKLAPLTAIQGMSPNEFFRLREIGVVDIQHLALSDHKSLEQLLPYKRDMICDWIGQAILHLWFPDKMDLLKKFEIRTAQGLFRYNPDEEKIEKLVAADKISREEKEQVDYLQHVLKSPHMKKRMESLSRAADLD